MKKYFLYALLLAGIGFSACEKEEEETTTETSTGTETTNNTGGTGSGTESSATPGVLAKYDGTYNVTGTGHSRGTVIISNGGKKIDFDNGISYEVDDNNVYDRISAFNRYQIEFFDANNNQDRIRINLDPSDSNKVVGF